jgi:tRNA dimethylallyltransferase
LTQVSAILIAGPTASGKSDLAARLARALGGMVINADSMQVYRDLRVLTARPSSQDEDKIPHRLYGHIDGAINYSTGLWLEDASRALQEAQGAGQLPVFVGGTGLYFKALTQGLSAIPPVPQEVRAGVRARAAGIPARDLHRELMRRDPAAAARLRPSDPQRILRALEVFEATGKSLLSFYDARAAPLLNPEKACAIFLTLDRQALRAGIEARFEAMLASGALEEVAALRDRRLGPALPVTRAQGVPHLMEYLNGGLSLDEAARRTNRGTWAYVRRQLTFARHQLHAFQWLSAAEAEALALAVCRGFNAARRKSGQD